MLVFALNVEVECEDQDEILCSYLSSAVPLHGRHVLSMATTGHAGCAALAQRA